MTFPKPSMCVCVQRLPVLLRILIFILTLPRSPSTSSSVSKLSFFYHPPCLSLPSPALSSSLPVCLSISGCQLVQCCCSVPRLPNIQSKGRTGLESLLPFSLFFFPSLQLQHNSFLIMKLPVTPRPASPLSDTPLCYRILCL